MLSVIHAKGRTFYCDAECPYAESRYAECRFYNVILNVIMKMLGVIFSRCRAFFCYAKCPYADAACHYIDAECHLSRCL
jgi:hypothetical protein